ncbi:MAG: PQQ-binding-like beta-propeller repeat protein [Haloferacaceae archaeon]
MTESGPSRRQLLRAAGLAVLAGCGRSGAPDGADRPTGTTRTPTRTPTRSPTRTASPTATATPEERARPRFEAGPGACSLAAPDPGRKTWTHAGYDPGATRHPPAASAPNGFPLGRAWSVPTVATGPVLVDERRYYLRTATGVVALSPADGRVTWRRRASGPAGGIAVGADLLVLPTAEGSVYGLDPADGTARWSVAATATCPPVLTRDAVVLGTASGVVAHTRDEGTACFRVPTADPVVHLVADGDLAVAATAGAATGTLLAVDPARRAVRYAQFLTAPPTGLVGLDGELVVSTGERSRGLAAADGTLTWTAPVGPVVASGRYHYALGSDAVVALDDAGERAWRAAVPAPTGVAATGDVVVATSDADGVAFQVHDARTGRRRVRQLDDDGRRFPVVADDRVITVGDDRTYVDEEAGPT